MKIKMIGTGSMISNDNPACYLINNKIMIDLPNGIVKVLKKEDLLQNITDVFITHIHGDHIFDLPFLFLDRIKSKKPLNVYIDKKWFVKIKKLVKLAFPRQYYNIFYNSQIKFLDNNKSISIDDLTISRILMSHGYMKPSYGYYVCQKDKRIFFTGDTSVCKNLIQTIEQSDVIICDCTMTIGNEKHLGVDNIKQILKSNPNIKVIPSHMGVNAKNQLKKIKEKNLIIKDDMEEVIV